MSQNIVSVESSSMRNDSWTSQTSTRTEQICFTTMESEGEGWDSVKLPSQHST